jgi:hypothetical protein
MAGRAGREAFAEELLEELVIVNLGRDLSALRNSM